MVLKIFNTLKVQFLSSKTCNISLTVGTLKTTTTKTKLNAFVFTRGKRQGITTIMLKQNQKSVSLVPDLVAQYLI